MISGAFQEQFFTCKNVGSESLMPRLVLITTGLEILLVKLILQSIFCFKLSKPGFSFRLSISSSYAQSKTPTSSVHRLPQILSYS